MTGSIKRRMAFWMAMACIFTATGCGSKGQNTGQKASENTGQKASENVGETPSEKENTGNAKTEVSQKSDSYYNQTGYPICDEPITIKVSGINHGDVREPENTFLAKYVKEELGINMEFGWYAADAFASQYALMLSTQNIPDLIVNGYTVDKAQVNNDGKLGFWLDMSKYWDLMPNLKAFMEKYPAFATYQKTDEGNIYSLSRVDAADNQNIKGQLYYDKTVLQEAYTGEINSVDDFYEALKAVKKTFPDKIPFSMTLEGPPAIDVSCLFHQAFGIVGSADVDYKVVADKNGKVSLANISDNFREYYKYMNKLYKEGLLDENCFVASPDYGANMEEGKYAFWSHYGWYGPTSMTTKDQEAYQSGNKDVIKNYSSIIALTSDLQPQKTRVMRHGVLTQAKIYIGAETKYPEAICRLLDYFATDEGQLMAVYGKEGETFEYVPDAYGNKLIDNSKFADLSKYESAGVWQNQAVVLPQAFSFAWVLNYKWLDEVSLDMLTTISKDGSHKYTFNADELYRWKTEIKNPCMEDTPWTFTTEESKERVTIYNDIRNYLKQMKVSFISGKTDPNNDDDWKGYVEQVKKMNYDRLMEIEQAAWDRMVAASRK